LVGDIEFSQTSMKAAELLRARPDGPGAFLDYGT
jgi:hypothetical protein